MAYRGNDLELRVPQGFSTGRGAAATGGDGPAWLERALGTSSQRRGGDGESGGTIWVEPGVLAAVNQAYDLATVHRAHEVRLEHLVHAMTLVDACAVAMAHHGIQVAALRLESAQVIAAEKPNGYGGGRGTPETSEDMIDTLRLAADRAYSRRSPVSTEDILAVLFDMKRDTSSRTLLARHRSDWSLSAPQEPRDRIRVSAGSYHVAEEPAMRQEAQSMTDAFQNNRIDAMERAINSLLAEFQRGQPAPAPRDEPAPVPQRSASFDRIAMLEQALAEARREAETRPIAAPVDAVASSELIDRLARVERNVDAKFNELARTWGLLGERLQGVEDLLLERMGEDTSGLPEDLAGRLDGIAAIEPKLAALDSGMKSLMARLGALEVAVQGNQPAEFDLSGLESRIDDLAYRFDQRPETVISGSTDLGPLDARLQDIDNRTTDAAYQIETMASRIEAVASLIDAQRGSLSQTSATLGSELKALASAVSAQHANTERFQAVFVERLQGLLGQFQAKPIDIEGALMPAMRRETSQLASQLASQLKDSEARGEKLRIDTLQRVHAFETRMAAVEQRTETSRKENERLFTAQSAQLRQLHESLITVNTNQQTIAGSLDRWRADNSGDLSAISSRLGRLEIEATKPVEMLGRLSADMGDLKSTLVTRQKPSSPFRMWLFGTDDWLSASWARRDRAPR